MTGGWADWGRRIKGSVLDMPSVIYLLETQVEMSCLQFWGKVRTGNVGLGGSNTEIVLEAEGLEETPCGMSTDRKEKGLQEGRVCWPAPAHGGYSIQVRVTLSLGQNGHIPRAQLSGTQSAHHRGVLRFLHWVNGYSQGGREPTIISWHPERIVIASLFHRDYNCDTNSHTDLS